MEFDKLHLWFSHVTFKIESICANKNYKKLTLVKSLCSLLQAVSDSVHTAYLSYFISHRKKDTWTKKKWVNLSLGTEELRVSKCMTTISYVTVFPESNFGPSIYADWIFRFGSAFWIMVAHTPAYRPNLLLGWFKGIIRSSNLASCKTTGHYILSNIPVLSAIIHFWCKSNAFTSGFWRKLKTTETENLSYHSVCWVYVSICTYTYAHTWRQVIDIWFLTLLLWLHFSATATVALHLHY